MLREDKADTYKQTHIHINTLQSDDVCVMIYSIESRESTFYNLYKYRNLTKSCQFAAWLNGNKNVSGK